MHTFCTPYLPFYTITSRKTKLYAPFAQSLAFREFGLYIPSSKQINIPKGFAHIYYIHQAEKRKEGSRVPLYISARLACKRDLIRRVRELCPSFYSAMYFRVRTEKKICFTFFCACS